MMIEECLTNTLVSFLRLPKMTFGYQVTGRIVQLILETLVDFLST